MENILEKMEVSTLSGFLELNCHGACRVTKQVDCVIHDLLFEVLDMFRRCYSNFNISFYSLVA